MSEKPCFVYVIARREGDRITAPVKVGITGNITSRLGGIQTSCPFQICLTHALRAPSRAVARSIELRFHLKLKSKRLVGEWFNMPPCEALAHLFWDLDQELQERGYDEARKAKLRDAFGAGEADLEILRRLHSQRTTA